MSDHLWHFAEVLPTTIVAIVVAYIAWQQWQTAKQKLRLDLFDKRYASFERILAATNTASSKIMMSNAPATTGWLEGGSPLIECWRAAREAHLLFGDKHVDEILQKLNSELSKLAIATGELREAPPETRRDLLLKPNEHSTAISKLQDQLFLAVEKHLELSQTR